MDERTDRDQFQPFLPDDAALPANADPSAPVGRGHAAIAWTCIGIMTAAIIALRSVDLASILSTTAPRDSAVAKEDPIGTMLMEVQAKYIVGASAVAGQSDGKGLMYASADALNVGTVGQRQRFAILANELAGADEASKKLNELDELIKKEQEKRPFELSPEQARIHGILHQLYDPPTDSDDAIDGQVIRLPQVEALTATDRQFLIDELGWFGHLALVPPNATDAAVRETVLHPAERVTVIIVAVAVLALIAGLGGLAGLVTVIVLFFMRKLRGGLPVAIGHHGIYAETFAIWIAAFFGAQILTGLVLNVPISLTMLVDLLIFFGSLAVLAWPVYRGVPWQIVRRDIGWTTWKRNPIGEAALGLGGYLMTLPILAIGLAITLVFLFVQQHLSPTPPFEPSGGPAHPIFKYLAGNDWLFKIQILLLASVAAPIVEETMFRGVMYGQLRQATAKIGAGLSIALSALLSALIFAAIHPQGWVAIPALMSLAVAFALMREWRGSVLPCMIMHGTSNFIVLTLAMVVLPG